MTCAIVPFLSLRNAGKTHRRVERLIKLLNDLHETEKFRSRYGVR